MAVDERSGTFGGKLRDARERRGISLRQIANATKISVGALEALERNEFSRLPGGIFSRAFVRSYSAEVGLDPDAMIQEFIAQFPSDAVTAGQPTADRGEDYVSVENDRRMASTFLWLIGLSLPIAGIVLHFATAGRGAAPQAPSPSNQPTPSADAAHGAAGHNQPIAAPAAPAAVAPAVTAPAPPPTAIAAERLIPADRLTVVLSVRRPCWVSASVDGERQIERLLQRGERQTIEVRREMIITAGDASAITLTLNGAPARPLGKTGDVVTARFNLNNYKDYVQGGR
jgi:cytoskeletal protein RodZ